jgi:hypothetical protein
VDPEEDLLRQVLSEGPVSDQPEDVVEDGLLVAVDDDRESAFVAFLRLAEYFRGRLCECHSAARIAIFFRISPTIYVSVKCQ